MPTVLDVVSLDAGYAQGRPVVRQLDLTVEAGEVVALLGPNGAGKTTVLMTLAGLLPALGGTVQVAGTPLPPGQPRRTARAGLVLVPDDRALFTGLSVRENLSLASRQHSADLDRVLAWFPALGKRLKLSAGQLSGGEQQMLAIGRALVQQPKVLLIDELSMGLAPVVVEALLPVIRQVSVETGAGIVLVEQHVRLALSIADRGVVLAHGAVVLEGPAAELLADPGRLESAYLGQVLA
jgi:branched-chain amino acid transport system ATP-binding protein